MSDFDASAREWDNNPEHWERSQVIASAILDMVPVHREMKALEFGAGTAILSFLLESHFREIVLMDSSREMINVMHEKVDKTGLTHLKPLFFDLETDEYPEDDFGCIYTQMAMHHVREIEMVVSHFYRMLVPGGWLAIADLHREDGSFHHEGFTGHKGFDVSALQGTLEKAGFRNVITRDCYTVKKTRNDIEREYPLFLMVAQRWPEFHSCF